uniref:Uncharacterized protein n=1 Tax=Anopheles atroparvus TaxID=41427 RepID=A0AAG5DXL8_ANOAO
MHQPKETTSLPRHLHGRSRQHGTSKCPPTAPDTRSVQVPRMLQSNHVNSAPEHLSIYQTDRELALGIGRTSERSFPESKLQQF